MSENGEDKFANLGMIRLIPCSLELHLGHSCSILLPSLCYLLDKTSCALPFTDDLQQFKIRMQKLSIPSMYLEH